jgi:hypothetical protein
MCAAARADRESCRLRRAPGGATAATRWHLNCRGVDRHEEASMRRIPATALLRSLLLGLVLGVSMLGVVGLARAIARPKSPLEHLLPPENVAATTRADLRGRMSRHGNNMSALVKAVVLLDRPTVTALAGRIADEEYLAKIENGGLDRWRPLLPKPFFVEQEALRAAATALAESAARGASDEVLADRFSTLTHTCVRCHGSYVHDLPGGTALR